VIYPANQDSKEMIRNDFKNESKWRGFLFAAERTHYWLKLSGTSESDICESIFVLNWEEKKRR
jgi:hypothetical protein